MTAIQRRRADRLADLMADGCPTLGEAAYRMRQPIKEVEATWKTICRALGRQAA